MSKTYVNLISCTKISDISGFDVKNNLIKINNIFILIYLYIFKH